MATGQRPGVLSDRKPSGRLLDAVYLSAEVRTCLSKRLPWQGGPGVPFRRTVLEAFVVRFVSRATWRPRMPWSIRPVPARTGNPRPRGCGS